MAPEDEALVDLGRWLTSIGYRFVTPTPATHARVNRRARHREARPLTRRARLVEVLPPADLAAPGPTPARARAGAAPRGRPPAQRGPLLDPRREPALPRRSSSQGLSRRWRRARLGGAGSRRIRRGAGRTVLPRRRAHGGDWRGRAHALRSCTEGHAPLPWLAEEASREDLRWFLARRSRPPPPRAVCSTGQRRSRNASAFHRVNGRSPATITSRPTSRPAASTSRRSAASSPRYE